MLHRHPFLSLLTLLYLGFVGLVTLTPGQEQPDYAGLAGRVLARLVLERGPPCLARMTSSVRASTSSAVAPASVQPRRRAVFTSSCWSSREPCGFAFLRLYFAAMAARVAFGRSR